MSRFIGNMITENTRLWKAYGKDLWQRHQVFMTMFARKGHKVFYIENLNPSPRLCWKAVGQGLSRLGRIWGRQGHKRIHENITVISPFVLPSNGRFASSINKKACLTFLRSRLRKTRNCIVWTYFATSRALNLIESLSPRAVVYDCVSDARLHPDSPRDIDITEHELVTKADVIFTDNAYHVNRFKEHNLHIHMIPPGVDYELFVRSNTQPVFGLRHGWRAG